MFKNNLKIAWRNIRRNKLFSGINILGLTAGLTGFIIVLTYLNYEMSYDTWHPDLARTFKISMKQGGDINKQTPAPLASLLKEKFPEVESATAIMSTGDFEVQVDVNNKSFFQKGLITADSFFFKVFPYELTHGDQETVFDAPDAVVISESLANKIFGTENPIGRPIKLFNALSGTITGVLRTPSSPSHLRVDLLMRDPNGKQSFHWENHSFDTYIKTKTPMDQGQIESRINRVYYEDRYAAQGVEFDEYMESGKYAMLFTDAVPQLHNYPKYDNSNIKTIQILFMLALMLLLAGAINFSNLSIAKAMRRIPEVGVRKVLGSSRRGLIGQFMVETAMQCVLAMIFALVMAGVFLPSINALFGLNLQLFGSGNIIVILGQILLCLAIVIVFSGLYPAFFLSRYSAVEVLKGTSAKGKDGKGFRNALLVVQFAVSVLFLMALLGITKQLNFMEGRDKGFEVDQVLRLEAPQQVRERGFDALRNDLLDLSGVRYVAKTTQVPGDVYNDSTTTGFQMGDKKFRFTSVKVSKDYFKTLGAPILEGRDFTSSISDQKTQNVIINSAAAKRMGGISTLGKIIFYEDCETPMRIVGFVGDFNVMGPETSVTPTVFSIGNEACRYQSGGALLVKLEFEGMASNLSQIEAVWNKHVPGVPLRYSFLDNNFERLLVDYQRLRQVISYFTMVALLISIMGLFALTAYITRQRSKEISIRKVLGANTYQLNLLLGKEFLVLMAIAFAIATPLAWYGLRRWLENFAYRTDLEWWVFVVGGLGMAIIAMLVIGSRTTKVANTNPVKSLRSE